ncbi:MAG: zinc-dependent alcohol dehydrogenase family protein [Thiotrichales bacterium]
MKAVLMTDVGGPEVLQPDTIAAPEIESPTAIKVRLAGAGVNPVDTKLRGRGLFYTYPLPVVLGCDGAGEVIEIGAEVTRFKPGDSIWFCHGGLGAEQGNYAEFNVLDARWAAPRPSSIDAVTAAGGPLVLITAWNALFDKGGLQPGQSVLIHAGAGGVGHVAIQLAKNAGARVCTTVGSLEKEAFVRALGADHVVHYPREDVAQAVLDWTNGDGVDLALDTVGPEAFRQSIPAVRHFGRLITLLDPGLNVDWKEARIRNLMIGFELMLTPMLRKLDRARARHVEILESCAQLIDAGKLRIEVSHRLPLAAASEAHRHIETGRTTGKLVLEIAGA